MKHGDMPPQAKATQQLASIEARYASGDTLPEPPDGYPAIKSIPGALCLGIWCSLLKCATASHQTEPLSAPATGVFLMRIMGGLGLHRCRKAGGLKPALRCILSPW